LVCPVIKIKSIESDALPADGNYSQLGPNQPIETIAIHA